MLTPLQKQAAQAIVNIFETGTARGRYGQVTLLAGDSGHLTYGRAQTTLASGNLYLLVKAYCEAAGASAAAELEAYLDRLLRRDLSLDRDMGFRELLRAAGDDPVMQAEQDAFFDRVYWEPAVKSAAFITARTALGAAIVYDSRVHGSWHLLRDRTLDQHGALEALGEEAWLARYVELRRDWLATHSNQLLHKTVYRMDSFVQLIGKAKWDLGLPFSVRGVRIDEDVLTAPIPVRASAASPDERTLMLRRPFMRGEDVRAVQQALADSGIAVDVDGVFGPGTERAVIGLQTREGLTLDGIVGPATRAALGL